MSLQGKTIVFTGTLQTKRADATAMAVAAGAKVVAAVSGNTDILVAGPGAGSKKEEAMSRGVEVWDEAQFVAATSGAASSSAPPAAGGKKGRGAKAEAAEPEEPPVKKGRGKAKAEVEEPAEEPPAEPPAKKGRGKAKAEPAAEAEEPPAKKGRGKAPAEAEPPSTPKAKAAASTAATPAGYTPGGGRRVDRLVPNAAQWRVLDEWAIKLLQTNIGGGANNNKYYIIQALKSASGFALWTRWGRVGEDGQSSLENHSSEEGATRAFMKKFKDKTKNDWSARLSGTFVKHDGKYQLVETEEGDEGGEGEAPLGKLSEEQIRKGQAVLEELKQVLESGKGNSSAIASLSSQFYSLIPTVTGRVAPPPISTPELLGAKEAQLLFWLKMGFEGVTYTPPPLPTGKQQVKAAAKVEKEAVQLENPIEGLFDLPVPKTLKEAAQHISDNSSINSSVKRGEKLAKEKAGKPVKPLDADRYGAIVLYTGNSIYRKLNLALRQFHQDVPPYMSYLRLLFESMAAMPQKKLTLWRGIAADLYDEYEEGKVITWWTVSSCTADKSVAQNFMKQLGGTATLLTLDTTSAMDITPLSIYTNEKESLLMPGTKLQVWGCGEVWLRAAHASHAIRVGVKVLSRSKKGKLVEIHVKEVGNSFH